MNIELQGVTKRFGAQTAADAVSLSIRHGECFFLLGPSGCGKTTLLRILAGFCAPDAGDVYFDGVRVTTCPPHRRRTGMVFQHYALWPHLTVFDNVAFGLTVPGRRVPPAERRRRVFELLSLMRMESLADRTPGQLSGGQQQRVALARALAPDPACLLLDEPLSNLDARLRLELRLEIRRLVRRLGMTTVYVTHDQKEALSMADRCALLCQGRVVQVGTPRDVYERPANRFAADFIGGANLIPGTLRARTADAEVVATAFGEWQAAPGPSGPAPGTAVTLAVRPENLVLGGEGGSAPNRFGGRLADAVYGGDTTEYWVRMADGSLLKALASVPAPAQAPGSAVSVCAAPGDVIVLAD